MNKKQKEFWKQFCQSKNKDEETLKKSLFNGDLTKEEFEYVPSCVIGPLFAPSLFYPVLFKIQKYELPEFLSREIYSGKYQNFGRLSSLSHHKIWDIN